MKSIASPFFLFVLMSLALSNKALACSCYPDEDVEAFAKAEHVIFGELSNLSTRDGHLLGEFSGEHVFKGDMNAVKFLRGANKTKDASCEIRLTTGKFIVFASSFGEVKVDACSNSRFLQLKEVAETLIPLQELSDELNGVSTVQETVANKKAAKLEPAKARESEKTLWEEFLEYIDW